MCTKLSNTIFSLGTNCCPVVCDQCCLHKWTPEAILKQKFSALIPIFISYHLFKTSGKYMYKNSCCPRISCFWLFLCDVNLCFNKAIWSSRDYLKNVFSNRVLACSCSLFYLKEKNNQNPYVFDWLQSFMITCEYKFFNWIVSIQMTKLEAQQEPCVEPLMTQARNMTIGWLLHNVRSHEWLLSCRTMGFKRKNCFCSQEIWKDLNKSGLITFKLCVYLS